jgi:hypothetical protein
MTAQFQAWLGGEWVLQEADESSPRCRRHEGPLVEVAGDYVCPSCVLARWMAVLDLALPSVPRGDSVCEGHGKCARLRDREACPTCLLADLRRLIRDGGLRGAIENGQVVLRAPGRQSCARHGMPLANDGRSFVCLWCLPFLAAATARSVGQVYRPGDGSPLGTALELTNELALATADRKWRTIDVHLDPTVPPAIDLPGAGEEPDNLVALTVSATPDTEPPVGLLVQQLALATEQNS